MEEIMIIKGYLFAVAYAAFCLLLAFILYKLGLPKKYTRKVVHVLVAFEWCILSYYHGPTYHFLAVCLVFTLGLFLIYRKNLAPMISSEDDNAPGTVYYGLAMSAMALISMFIPKMLVPFGIGAFVTSFGDGFAGIVGQLAKRHNPKIYKNKSLFGSVANLVVSFIVCLVFSQIFTLGLSIFDCFAIALLAVGLELITPFGLDNISTTLATAFLAFGFINLPEIYLFVFPIIITPLIIALVFEKRVLTPLGILLAIILDLGISLTLGNSGFIILFAFLFLSVLTDKIKKKRITALGGEKRGDCRDHIQVIANGLVPLTSALLFAVSGNRAFLFAYVVSLAEAMGDTCASGIGVFARKTVDPFRMKKCDKGLSGGMSLIGTLSALVGSYLISLIAYLLSVIDLKLFILSGAIAFVGTVFDSMLGSLVQVKYACKVCGKITEKEEHCNSKTEKHSGLRFFDNDVVNFLSGAFSALLSIVIYTFAV
jgi:uncharacterized protein (TIGR00297 family)